MHLSSRHLHTRITAFASKPASTGNCVHPVRPAHAMSPTGKPLIHPRPATQFTPCGRARNGFSRELLICSKRALDLHTQMFSHRQSRLGCRPNAGFAQWAEPHGCGESAVRTWMSVRRGPTERDRSEGTPTKEEPNQEHKPLVTWGFIK